MYLFYFKNKYSILYMCKSLTKSVSEFPSLATTVLIPLVRHLNRDYFGLCEVRDQVKLMER